jgi:serine/threonine-protein kinase
MEVDLFMQKALAKSPADRFATPREFITALEQLQERVQTREPGPRPIPQPDPKPLPSVPAREGKLVMLSNGQIFPLKGELMLVGRRDPTQGIYPEILLTDTDKTVGRRHAYLRNQQGIYTVEDLYSQNKTRLNGVIVTPYEERILKDGDILRFGSVEVRFELH